MICNLIGGAERAWRGTAFSWGRAHLSVPGHRMQHTWLTWNRSTPTCGLRLTLTETQGSENILSAAGNNTEMRSRPRRPGRAAWLRGGGRRDAGFQGQGPLLRGCGPPGILNRGQAQGAPWAPRPRACCWMPRSLSRLSSPVT